MHTLVCVFIVSLYLNFIVPPMFLVVCVTPFKDAKFSKKKKNQRNYFYRNMSI